MLDASTGAPHFFILGAPRSGTTLLRSILATHSSVAIPGETGFLPKLLRLKPIWHENPERFSRLAFANGRLARLGLNREEFLGRIQGSNDPDGWIASLYIFAVGEAEGAQILVGDKTPNYGLHWELISERFEKALFITIVRDPLDVANSLVRQSWGPRTAVHAARLWSRNAEATLALQASGAASRQIMVRYEDLVADTEAVTISLCQFLGLSYEPAMVTQRSDLDAIKAANFHPESHQRLGGVVAPNGSSSILTSDELNAVAYITSERAADCGYDIDKGSAPRAKLLLAAHARESASKVREQRNRLRTIANLVRS